MSAPFEFRCSEILLYRQFFNFFQRLSFKPGSAFILILLYQFSYFVCERARPLCYSKRKPLLLGATPNQLGGVVWKSILWERRPGFYYRCLPSSMSRSSLSSSSPISIMFLSRHQQMYSLLLRFA